jgi:hypothetical protein
MPLTFYEDKDKVERSADEEKAQEAGKPRRKGFLATWRHAFSMKVAEDEFNADDMALIERVANEIVKRRMTTPALLFLESVKPLSFFASQAMYVFRPFIIAAMLGNPDGYERFALLMEKSEGMEKLIQSIETLENRKALENQERK